MVYITEIQVFELKVMETKIGTVKNKLCDIKTKKDAGPLGDLNINTAKNKFFVVDNHKSKNGKKYSFIFKSQRVEELERYLIEKGIW